MLTDAYIGLGSNIGEREQYLRAAVQQLDSHPKLSITRCSHIYETDPVGLTQQPMFLNMVVSVTCQLTPHELLEYMMQVERVLGRTRDVRYGPRTLDLDLLLYGDETLNTPQLIVPHPRMEERAFVIVPLLDVLAPGGIRSWLESIAARLEKLEGKESVKRWKTNNSHSASELFAN